MAPSRLAVFAPAKINLYLEVVGRRPDGYHDLATLFLALPWGDDVEVEVLAAPGVALEVAGDVAVPLGEENLAWRAARDYLAAAARGGAHRGARVRLRKRVPAGAGLGGGSSDAGAVLRALQGTLGLLPAEELEEVARRLGADVPFFLHGSAAGRLAVGRGRGDRIDPLPPAPSLDYVLLLPPLATATARVFAAVAEGGLRPPPSDGLSAAVAALRTGVPRLVREAHYNGLGVPAMRAYEDLRRFAVEVERRLGRPPCLSGSGSTLYDVPDPGEAPEVLRRLEGLPGRRLHLKT